MSVTPGDLLVAVMAHHIAGAEIGGLSEWIVSGVWHALWTALVPALLMGAVLISTGFSAASVRLLSSRPPSLADPLANRTAGPGAGRDEPAGGRAAVHPVQRFYSVTFGDERGFRLWAERVVEFTSILQDILPDLSDVRPVIFVELKPMAGATPRAYVSAGARGLAAHICGGAKVDPTPVSSADLPRGLTMLFGEGVDAAEYERWHV